MWRRPDGAQTRSCACGSPAPNSLSTGLSEGLFVFLRRRSLGTGVPGSRFRSVRLVRLRLYVNRKGLSCGRFRAANPASRAAQATIAQDRRNAGRGDIIPLSSPFAFLVGFLSFVRTEVVRAISDRFQAVRTSTDHHQATRLRCGDRNGRDGNASEHMAPPRKLFLPCATAWGRWIASRSRRKTEGANPSIACVAALRASADRSWSPPPQAQQQNPFDSNV
jgi:hypothetical protein